MTIFPQYIDNIIFEDFQGVYVPEPEQVRINLDNNSEQNCKYIGTYFPRSFIESCAIFNGLYRNQRIMSCFDLKETIYILDVGAGTGGNLMGLLHFLHSKNLQNKQITIYTLEGNTNAIDKMRKIYGKVKSFLQFNNINLLFAEGLIESSLDLDIRGDLGCYLEKINKKFDIIMSFKFLSEFYNLSPFKSSGAYNSFIDTASRYLHKQGLLVVSDVTPKTYNKYIPEILSEEINEYVRNNEALLRIIIPVPCGLWYNLCTVQKCFTQRMHKIQHSHAENDTVKYSYRVLAHREFAEHIYAEQEVHEIYRVSYSNNNLRTEPCCSNGNRVQCGNIEIPNGFSF